MPRATSAPTREEWASHADDGDLYVNGWRIEVKKLSATFTCAEDWPFGAKFIVCAKHAWENANPKPTGFIYLSANASHIAIVYGAHCHNWRVEKRKDSRYIGETQDFLFSPIEDVDWRVLDN
jgi:hypothetical protein